MVGKLKMQKLNFHLNLLPAGSWNFLISFIINISLDFLLFLKIVKSKLYN